MRGDAIVLDEKLWGEIKEHYRIARECFDNVNKKNIWHRNDNLGYYHLWQAYYLGLNQEEKLDILFARILMLMHHEVSERGTISHYNDFIVPAKSLYDKHIDLIGTAFTQKEYDQVKFYVDEHDYYESENSEYADAKGSKAYSYIEGINNVKDYFQFYDAWITYFEHNKEYAIMKFDYCGNVVTLRFDGIQDISIHADPIGNYVYDFYCYKASPRTNYILFDLGSYHILCESIKVV